MINATESFMLALQATAEVKDNREEGERAGYIEHDMNDEEAIGVVLANMLLMNTEEMSESETLHSGQIMTSFLFDYYNENVLTSFLTLYAYSKNLSTEELIDNNISTYFDFEDVISEGNKLGWKNHWNAFKAPYRNQWEAAINK